MKDFFKKLFNKNEKIHLIGIFIEDKIYTYQYLQLSFNNSILKIEDRFNSDSIDGEFQKKLKKDYPILLYIDGDGVLNKEVSKKVGYRNDLIFNASSEDFHFFEYYQNNQIFISVIRKSIVNDIIIDLNSRDFYVSHISIGPFSLANLLTVNKKYNQLSSPFSTIILEENNIKSFKNEKVKNTNYNFEEEIFNQNELPLLATFIGYKFKNSSIEFKNDFLFENINEFKFKKRFKFARVFAVLFFFVSLFISHNLLNSYLNSLKAKKIEYTTIQNSILQIESLKEGIKTKEAILKKSGVTNKIFMTKLISDIGNLTSTNIEIESIDINPINKKIRSGEEIDFNMNEIIIDGSTIDDTAFNNWILKLNELKWIKKIEIIKYVEEKNRMNSFNLKVKV